MLCLKSTEHRRSQYNYLILCVEKVCSKFHDIQSCFKKRNESRGCTIEQEYNDNKRGHYPAELKQPMNGICIFLRNLTVCCHMLGISLMGICSSPSVFIPRVTVWHHSAEPRDAKTITLGTDLHIRTSHHRSLKLCQ